MLCKKCGQDLQDNAKFCPACGHRVLKEADRKETGSAGRNNILPAILISIILILGAAVVYLLFFKQDAPDKAGESVTAGNSDTIESAEPEPGQTEPSGPDPTTVEGAYESALAKLKIKTEDAPEAGKAEDYKIVYGEANEVDTSLTERELNALANYNRPGYDSVKNIQISINDDNTADFSAVVDTQYFIDDILSKSPDSSMSNLFPLMIFLPDTVEISGNAAFEIKDNKIENLEMSRVTFMGIEIPASMYSTPESKAQIITAADEALAKSTEENGTYLDSVKIRDGELAIKGEIPSSLTWEPVNP